MIKLLHWAAIVISAAVIPVSHANSLFINIGGGPQVSGDQTHLSGGIDYEFWQHQRSARQMFTIGASYTYLQSNQGPNQKLHAVSIYPQLTLTPANNPPFTGWLPEGSTPYFFVRALGPTFISEATIGEREQHNHFTFQAGFGVGVKFTSARGAEHDLRLAWKHFSNANLYSTNDGIDIPIVLSFGMSF